MRTRARREPAIWLSQTLFSPHKRTPCQDPMSLSLARKHIIGETLNQRCVRITADLTNPCRCLKEMGKHDEPPRGLVGRRRMSFLCGVTNRSGANFPLPVAAMTVKSPTDSA